MMGHEKQYQGQLFYTRFNLERRVRIEQVVHDAATRDVGHAMDGKIAQQVSDDLRINLGRLQQLFAYGFPQGIDPVIDL